MSKCYIFPKYFQTCQKLKLLKMQIWNCCEYVSGNRAFCLLQAIKMVHFPQCVKKSSATEGLKEASSEQGVKALLL